MRQGLLAVVLVAVVAALGVTTWLLIRTVDAADDIEEKSARIARTGRGINDSTDAIVQLRRTNEIARSILDSVRPLDQQLGTIVARSQSIDDTAGAIDATAGAINQTAATINSEVRVITGEAHDITRTAVGIRGTAGRIETEADDILVTSRKIDRTATGINRQAAGILETARTIDRDVRLINVFARNSIDIARRIERDTTDILDQTLAAHQTAACIDQRLGGRAGRDPHCLQPPGPEERE